jgi:hypothetical protein
LSAALAAVTVTIVEEVTVGATKRPLLEIVPLLACQVTAVLLVEVKVAENCCFPPEEMVAVSGATLIVILFGGTIVIAEIATVAGSPAVVAVTFTFVEVVTTGAANRPVFEMVPALAVQTKDAFPVEVAVNCCWAPEASVNVAGERLILFEAGEVCAGAEFEIPAQPVEK